MHLGHQKVIETGKAAAKEGLKLALMTFNQHPSIVFSKKVDPEAMQYLTSLSQKEAHMADLESTIFTK